MPKDFLDNELKVGDTVIFMVVKYRTLCKGIIAKLGNKKATIKHDYIENKRCTDTTYQFFDQIVKIEDKDKWI